MDWPDGVGRMVLSQVDSTMAEAARRAPEVSEPTWILAHQQTAAHGRRGRPWAMPAGSFAATLVMRPAGDAGSVALRSFVAALALYDALVMVTGRATGLSLKWPNDVLLNGGKLAGILLESVSAGRGVAHLAIGIGVNLATAPDASKVEAHALRPVSLLSETGVLVTPDAFLVALARAYAKHEARFIAHGFAPIRDDWIHRAARLGQLMTARLPNTQVTGTFETVDECGQLVLKTSKGRVAIPAADVFFE